MAEGIVVKPIQSNEKCEDFDFDQGVECGQPAGYAYIVTQESCCCEKHGGPG